MAFKPLHDRVLVKRVQGEEKTKGGLIIPDNAKEKPAEGEIIAVGEGARKELGARQDRPLEFLSAVHLAMARKSARRVDRFATDRRGLSRTQQASVDFSRAFASMAGWRIAIWRVHP